MKILIDNGHGSTTAGKRSPDGTLREYLYAREVAQGVVNALKRKGYDAELLTPETTDVTLTNRCKRANLATRQAGGAARCLLVSIHNNAAGSDGKWHDARGWSAHVSLNASKRSKQLAFYLADAARAEGLTVRKPLPGQAYWPQNLAICRDTSCPAVLTENLFQDNREDVAFLLSAKGKQAIINLHVEGIINYIKNETT